MTPFDRWHWAGTGTPRDPTGFMNGAVRSAARVVADILALRPTGDT